MAQEVEHFLGKEEVTGSNPVISSTNRPLGRFFLVFLPLIRVKIRDSTPLNALWHIFTFVRHFYRRFYTVSVRNKT